MSKRLTAAVAAFCAVMLCAAPAHAAQQQQDFQIPPPTMTELADGVYHYFGFLAAALW